MFIRKSIIILSIISLAIALVACGKGKTKISLTEGIRSENARQAEAPAQSDTEADEGQDGEYVIPEMEGTNEVSIAKNGKITNTIAQEFTEDYFDEDSLETFIKAEISDYNRKQGEDVVSLKSVKVDKEAQVVLIFDSPSYFADFNMQTFFYGTIEEAMLEDYNLNIDYVEAKTGESVDVDTVLSKEKRHIVITRSDRDRLDIVVPKDILYTSKNVEFNSKKKKEALAPQGEFNVIITK